MMGKKMLQKFLAIGMVFLITYFISCEGQITNSEESHELCPSGYHLLFEKLCIRNYTHHDEKKFWLEAKNICEKDSAQLFVMPNNKEYFFAKNETWSNFALDGNSGMILLKRYYFDDIINIGLRVTDGRQCFMNNYTQTMFTERPSSCREMGGFRCAVPAKLKYLTQVPWCPQGWLGSEYADVKQKCYFLLFQEEYTYEKAEMQCKSLDSHLVISKKKLLKPLQWTFEKLPFTNDVYLDVDETNKASMKNHFLCEKPALEIPRLPRASLIRRTTSNCTELTCKGTLVHPYSWFHWYVNNVPMTQWNKILPFKPPEHYIDLFKSEIQDTGEFYCEIGGSPSVPSVTSEKLTIFEGKRKVLPFSVKYHENASTILKKLKKYNKNNIKMIEIRLFQSENDALNITVHLEKYDTGDDWGNYENFLDKEQMKFILKVPAMCENETIEATNYRNGQSKPLRWPETIVNSIAEPNQTCITADGNILKRKCSGDFIRGAFWKNIQYNCDWDLNKRSVFLQNFSQSRINSKGSFQLNEKLNNDSEPLSPVDVKFIAEIVEKVSHMDNITAKTVENIANIFENLLKTKESTLNIANNFSTCLSDITKSFEKILSKCNCNIRLSKPLYYAQSLISKTEEFDTISAPFKNRPQFDSKQVTFQNSTDFAVSPQTAVTLILPPRLTNHDGFVPKMSLIIYQDSKLFPVTSYKKFVNSLILSITVEPGLYKMNYLSPVRLIFKPLQINIPLESSLCVFWDYSLNGGYGDWSEEGCWLNEISEGNIICLCTHLTHFAVLMDYSVEDEPPSNDHSFHLAIITYVGCSLSILGLSLTIITFAWFKKWRKKLGNRILCNLSLSLLFALVIFLGGIEQTNSPRICTIVAVLLHYFLLATFCWMLVEGIHHYLLFVRILDSYIPKFIIKSMISAWGFPLIIVTIVLSIDVNLYKNDLNYCWMSPNAMKFAFLLPVGIIISLNFICFVMVLKNICCNRSDISRSKRKNYLELIAAICILILLGLTWVFGFLLLDVFRIFFQYLFCICNSLQGFLIFIFMVIRDNNARDLWIHY